MNNINCLMEAFFGNKFYLDRKPVPYMFTHLHFRTHFFCSIIDTPFSYKTISRIRSIMKLKNIDWFGIVGESG